MNQREAVYKATHNALEDAGVTFEDFGNIEEVMTEDIRKNVHAIVTTAFQEGEVTLKDTPSNREKLDDESKLSSYVSGLISNWYRKDKRFNGNTTYKAKNPGSRTGQGDAQLKALKALHRQFVGVDEDKAAEIQAHIDTRVKEIQAEKAKKIDIDYSALDPELVKKLGIETE